MKIPAFIKNNMLLKMTSLNAVVIGIRLVISLFIQRLIAQMLGEAGVAAIGQLRNVMSMLMSISTLGVFNGVVKYVSEFRNDTLKLHQVFSTVFVFTSIGTLVAAVALFFWSDHWSQVMFDAPEYAFVFKVLAFVVPAIAMQRIFNGIVNGLSAYKKFAKIELFAYLLATGLMLYCLYNYSLDGVLIAIAVTPIIQLGMLLYLFGGIIKSYIKRKQLSFTIPFGKELLAFMAMSFVSTILLNYVEIDIRLMIKDNITVEDAGYWTAMTNISKNYMVFSTALFTLYVIPKFATITSRKGFKKEVFHIYKTLLPLFGVGMILVYVFRDFVIDLIYPEFYGMEPLFKWQLIGDFIRFASVILAYQFLAKKRVGPFVITELISLGLFYGFAKYLTPIYGAEGVVMGHALRYGIYFFVVGYFAFTYFKNKPAPQED